MMNAQDYLKLPYTHIIKQISDESGTYFHAAVLELDGCQSTGQTVQEAYSGLLEAMEGWIETKLENGFSVPLPDGCEDIGDMFALHIPRSLRSRLTAEAESEGVALDKYALYKLAQ